MKLEQCDKAPDHLRCVRLKGHSGVCDNVCATAFNNALQAAEDDFLNGHADRIYAKWPKAQCSILDAEPINPRVTYSDTPQPHLSDDAQDELGKVWDALHAAGISGEGKMSASEGVTLLAIRMKGGEQIEKACKGCGGCGLFETPVGAVVCDKCGGAGIAQ